MVEKKDKLDKDQLKEGEEAPDFDIGEATVMLKRLEPGMKEQKSIPVICPWCNSLFRVEEWETDQDKKIAPSHGMCPKCYKEQVGDLDDEDSPE